MTEVSQASESRDARHANFGGQVRLLRVTQGLTTAALAERCGVSRSLISQIETGRINPSLQVVRRLAVALEVPIGALFATDGQPGGPGPSIPATPSAPLATAAAPAAGVPAAAAAQTQRGNDASASRTSAAFPTVPDAVAPRIGLVRRDERKGLRLPKSKITYELLSPDLRGQLQVQWVELAPGETGPIDGFVHPGEECYVVLQGRVRFRVGDREVLLSPGDALTFDSSLPHSATNDGPETALAIAAMTPPSF